MRCFKMLLGVGLLLALSSCLGIDSKLTFNDNGSGNLRFQYRISKLFTDLDKSEGEAQAADLPLPITKGELEKDLSQTKGISVVSVEQSEDDTDLFLKGEVRFDSVGALNKSGIFEGMPITLEREGALTSFTQLLSEAREPIDKETLDAYQGFMDGYEIVLTLNAPRPIRSSNRGELSEDKKTLTYKISLYDLVQLTEKTEWRVSW